MYRLSIKPYFMVHRPRDQQKITSGLRKAKPEDGDVYEIGAKIRLEQGSLNTTYFDQTAEDVITNTFVGAGFVLANADQQSADSFNFGIL